MNEQVKAAWVTALTSGQYIQGKGKLHDHQENTFCCLGVLCDLYQKATGNGAWEAADDNTSRFRLTGDEAPICDLPGVVVTWSGVSDEQGPLIGLNDSDEFDFLAIAALIQTDTIQQTYDAYNAKL